MNRKWLTYGTMIALFIAILAFALHPSSAVLGNETAPTVPEANVGTSFTYQGYLEDNGSLANGTYDFQFKLFDALNGGLQVGSTVVADNVAVSDGTFSAKLNFGASAFGGGARWLEILVRPDGGGGYTTLTPRQELTPAPYALALPGLYTDEANDFVGVGNNDQVTGAEYFGVHTPAGDGSYGGMYIDTTGSQGWPFYGYATAGSGRIWTYYNGATDEWILHNGGARLTIGGNTGLTIGDVSTGFGLYINNTGTSDGIRIDDAGDDGIQIGNSVFPNYGLFMPEPGVTFTGLWPNTGNVSGEWALYTVDKIEAGNVAMGSLSLVAQVTGDGNLSVGDVVAVAGMTNPLPGGATQLPLVQLASGSEAGVVGVVESRMVYENAPGKDVPMLQSAEGEAKPGDYVLLTIYGIAQLKVNGPVQTGERLTASDLAGVARVLQSQVINGMTITEGSQVIGIALTSNTDGQGTISVFVTLH